MAGKHLLVVSQYFSPEQFRINDLCRQWVKEGYKVTVVTGIPNYPQGKFYPGYGLLKKRKEMWEGIEIRRIPLIPRGHSALGLSLNYISFVVSGWFWARFTRLHPDQVFIFEVSPMTQGLVGVWLAKRRKIPCDIYVTDLWPENFEFITGIHSPLIIGPLDRMTRRIYNGCRRIFTSAASFVPAIAARGVAKDKLVFWPQYAETFYRPIALANVPENKMLLPMDHVFTILFAGNIGEAQGLSALVKTAVLLKTAGKRVRFCLVGEGRYLPRLREEVHAYNVDDSFFFAPRVPAEDVPFLFAQAQASLICLGKSPVFAMTLPSKAQSCFSCGKPVVVCADGEIQEVVREASCGVCAPAGDAQQLSKAIVSLMESGEKELAQMGQNARAYSLEHYDKGKQMARLNELLFNGEEEP